MTAQPSFISVTHRHAHTPRRSASHHLMLIVEQEYDQYATANDNIVDILPRYLLLVVPLLRESIHVAGKVDFCSPSARLGRVVANGVRVRLGNIRCSELRRPSRVEMVHE